MTGGGGAQRGHICHPVKSHINDSNRYDVMGFVLNDGYSGRYDGAHGVFQIGNRDNAIAGAELYRAHGNELYAMWRYTLH